MSTVTTVPRFFCQLFQLTHDEVKELCDKSIGFGLDNDDARSAKAQIVEGWAIGAWRGVEGSERLVASCY